MSYKTITIQDIVDAVKRDPKLFPDGMNTKVFSGDFEGNYTHHLHIICHDKHGSEDVIFLGYEMHEDCGS